MGPIMLESDDELVMQRALKLAMCGRGWVEPNPMVGCVIVKDDETIGEGYHQKFGGPHAEPNALAACREWTRGATAVVTLEPCCHTNKKTPPCVPALIAAGIKRVVIAATDPNPQVNGRGIAQLRAAKIEVVTGVLQSQAEQLNAAFFCRTRLGRPYITLKWAQTADGKIAGPLGQRLQISGPAVTRAIHQIRAYSDAILVGINTVLADDPLLTVRDIPPCRLLLRVVLDRHLRLPLDSRLVRTAAAHRLLVYCDANAKPAAIESLHQRGVEVMPIGTHLPDVLADLHTRAVTHLLVEPGPTLAASFLAVNLTDRVWIVRAPKMLNDVSAPSAAKIDFPATGKAALGDDVLTEYLNPSSVAYFGQFTSVDLRLLGSG